MRLETEASWVHQGDDGERHPAIWKIDAADTSVILNLNTEEVLIGDFLGVASSLNASHHKGILGGDILLDTLLFLHFGNFVLNLS